ncbi:MAG: hypothetical protein KGL43_04040 [Burkholderiales bacterium]|nr:hypothetical protein [Burkholderiales bacterium]
MDTVLREAWLVIAADGFKVVFIDRARAVAYASRCHGIVYPLVREEFIHESRKDPDR